MATTIFTDAATAEATIQDSLRTAHKSLRAAVAGTGSIDQIAATIGTLTAQLTAIRAKADAALYQILSSDQQSKMTQIEAAGPGGPGGPGGPSRSSPGVTARTLDRWAPCPGANSAGETRSSFPRGLASPGPYLLQLECGRRPSGGAGSHGPVADVFASTTSELCFSSELSNG